MEQLRWRSKVEQSRQESRIFWAVKKKQLLITQQAGVEEVWARLPALTHLRKELFND
jgi:hypothetical protein